MEGHGERAPGKTLELLYEVIPSGWWDEKYAYYSMPYPQPSSHNWERVQTKNQREKNT